MARSPIYLAVLSNGPKPAHWAIFIPATGSDTKGIVIHVTGNPATGFFLGFKRNCDFTNAETKYQLLPLAQVDKRYIRESSGEGPETVDTTARDTLEMQATAIPPPERATNPFDPKALNCQNWIFDYIEKLIDSGIIDTSAKTVLETAPRVL